MAVLPSGTKSLCISTWEGAGHAADEIGYTTRCHEILYSLVAWVEQRQPRFAIYIVSKHWTSFDYLLRQSCVTKGQALAIWTTRLLENGAMAGSDRQLQHWVPRSSSFLLRSCVVVSYQYEDQAEERFNICYSSQARRKSASSHLKPRDVTERCTIHYFSKRKECTYKHISTLSMPRDKVTWYTGVLGQPLLATKKFPDFQACRSCSRWGRYRIGLHSAAR